MAQRSGVIEHDTGHVRPQAGLGADGDCLADAGLLRIAIDDQSIANIGRWPWPRDVHSRLTDILAQSKALVIGNTVFFTEPQFDPSKNVSHANIQKLGERIDSPSLQGLPAPAAAEVDAIRGLIASTESSMNTDRLLARSVRESGNVILGMLFQQFDR